MNAHNMSFGASLDPALFAMLTAAYAVIPFQIAVGYRSGVMQEVEFDAHRSKAHAGQSAHQYGEAVDAVPFLSGEAGPLNWVVDSPAYQAFVANMKAHGLVWGGDWHSFPDNDHFQSPHIPTTPNAAMQADYKNHVALAEIWRKVAAGAYTETAQ